MTRSPAALTEPVVYPFVTKCKSLPCVIFIVDHVIVNHVLAVSHINEPKSGIRVVERNPSTAYHPRTDGQSERTNQWLETYLRFFADHQQTNWAAYLPIAQFAHNNWPSDTTRKSPFFLLMGYNPRAEWTNGVSPLPQVTLRLDQLKEARDNAQGLMIKAQKSWVKHRDTPKYKVGDQVWLEGQESPYQSAHAQASASAIWTF